MKHMTNHNFLYRLAFAMLGFSIIALILYLRLRPRSPMPLPKEWSWFLLFCGVLSIILGLIYIYKLFFLPEKPNRVIAFLSTPFFYLYSIINKSFKQLYDLFIRFYTFRKMLDILANILLKLPYGDYTPYLWMSVLPRLIAACALNYDVILCNRFEYFYLVVPLLLLPVSLSLLLEPFVSGVLIF
jgi:hypothetical protein